MLHYIKATVHCPCTVVTKCAFEIYSRVSLLIQGYLIQYRTHARARTHRGITRNTDIIIRQNINVNEQSVSQKYTK